MRNAVTLLAALLAVGLAAPAAGLAATVTVESGQLVLRGGGEDNLFSVGDSDQAGRIYVEDSKTDLTFPAELCEPEPFDPGGANCLPQAGGIRVEMAGGDDTVTAYPVAQHVTVLGGDGNDTLAGHNHDDGSNHLDGGPGTDDITGGERNDVLLGGPGDDKLSGEGGDDELRGGDGGDDLAGDHYFDGTGNDVIDGGTGYDRIERDWYAQYSSDQQPIAVTMDGVADDGRPGERDNVTAVEKVHLSMPGRVVAAGEPVDFELFNHNRGFPTHLVGSPGADRLRSYDFADTIDGGAGDDWIEANFGDDTITGGPGRDTINAEEGSGACNFLVCRTGSGNDTVYVRDGEADSVACGSGNDVVEADPQDSLNGCEVVRLPSGGPGPAPGPARRCVVPRVKAGTALGKAKRRVRAGGCRAKVVRRASRKVRRGRVVKLSPKAGRRLKANAVVKIHVSRGAAKAKR